MKGLTIAGLVILAPQIAQACSYYSGSYMKCNGVSCSDDWECDSNNCKNGYCSASLPPWAISMIVFFSVFTFFTILGAVCRRQRMRR